MISFTEYMRVQEGLLPTRPPAKGLSKFNATHRTQDQRRKLVPTPRPAAPGQAVAPAVATVVPPKLIPKVKPGSPAGPGPVGVSASWFLC
jgi:hypothetical protein